MTLETSIRIVVTIDREKWRFWPSLSSRARVNDFALRTRYRFLEARGFRSVIGDKRMEIRRRGMKINQHIASRATLLQSLQF